MRLKSYWILVQNIHVFPIFNSPPFSRRSGFGFPLKETKDEVVFHACPPIQIPLHKESHQWEHLWLRILSKFINPSVLQTPSLEKREGVVQRLDFIFSSITI